MPRFQIKRKTREPKPEVVPEEKIDEQEVSLESSEESSEESEPLTEQFKTLEVTKQAPRDTQRRNEPEYTTPRRERSASVAPERTKAVRNQYYNRPRPGDIRSVYQNPRSIQYPKPSRRVDGRPRLHYRSFYGPNAERMTTQDKARQLYYTCFG